MSQHPRRHPRARTAEYLRHLLDTGKQYREQWQVQVRRGTSTPLHQHAIAQVIAEHLWETGEVAESVTNLPRQLRDRVSRALSGDSLSTQSLVWFIDAFAMTESHANALWDRFRDDAVADTTGQVANGPGTRRPVARSAYRTITLDEFHQLGRDGRPAVHETLQVIEAVERLDRYSFQFDTASASVEVLRGGRRGISYPHPSHPGIHTVDIMLDTPLLPGSTTVLGYRTIFDYDEPPAPEFRRMFRSSLPTATMEVRFHSRRLPRRLWWASWASLDEQPGEAEVVVLGRSASAHRVLRNVEDSIVGFLWEWD